MNAENMKKGTREWLLAMKETSALMSGVLAVTHPELYDRAHESMMQLRKEFENEDLGLWESVFNVIAVISNRRTDPHRDIKTDAHWYDILVTVGRYTDTFLTLRGLNAKLVYNSGTIVALSSRILLHEVNMPVGERVCYSWYMRESIFEYTRTEYAHWSVLKNYSSTDADDDEELVGDPEVDDSNWLSEEQL